MSEETKDQPLMSLSSEDGVHITISLKDQKIADIDGVELIRGITHILMGKREENKGGEDE